MGSSNSDISGQAADHTAQVDLKKRVNPFGKRWLANFAPMFVGQVFSMLGSSVVQFAIIWYITEQTGSAAMLATATAIGMLPQVFLGPFSGALVDRWNRKAVIVVADLIVAMATVVLMILFGFGLIQYWHIFTVLFIRSVAGIFQYPAMQASVTLMVPEEHYTRLSGLNQAVQGIISIVAPPLGALLISILPMQRVLGVDVITAAIAILLMVCLVKVPQPERTDELEAVTPASVWKDVRSGFSYVYRWKGMFKLMLIAASLNFVFAPANSLLPLYITKYFGRGAGDLALIESVLGAGMILGGVLISVWGGFKKKILTILVGILGIGLGILGIGIAPKSLFPLLTVFAGFTGIALTFANAPLGAITQSKIPPEMQGRVFMMFGSLATAAMPIGLTLSAPAVDRFGVKVLFIVTGVLALLIGILGFLSHDVCTLEEQNPNGEEVLTGPSTKA